MHTWPLSLREGNLELRSLQRGDRRAVEQMRRRNEHHLRPWDATDPERPGARPTFRALRRWAERQGKTGLTLHLLIVHEGNTVGQIMAGPILYGSLRTATIGYWVDEQHCGQGIATRALALLEQHLFDEMGMHRIELTVRPENEASLAVVRKAGLRCEGLRERAVHVDGAWRDHLVFARTVEETRTLQDDIPHGS